MRGRRQDHPDRHHHQAAEDHRPPPDPVGDAAEHVEPTAIPISSIDSTTPSTARSIPHSAAMPGEAKLIASTSKPSSALSSDAERDGDDLPAAASARAR